MKYRMRVVAEVLRTGAVWLQLHGGRYSWHVRTAACWRYGRQVRQHAGRQGQQGHRRWLGRRRYGLGQRRGGGSERTTARPAVSEEERRGRYLLQLQRDWADLHADDGSQVRLHSHLEHQALRLHHLHVRGFPQTSLPLQHPQPHHGRLGDYRIRFLFSVCNQLCDLFNERLLSLRILLMSFHDVHSFHCYLLFHSWLKSHFFNKSCPVNTSFINRASWLSGLFSCFLVLFSVLIGTLSSAVWLRFAAPILTYPKARSCL